MNLVMVLLMLGTGLGSSYRRTCLIQKSKPQKCGVVGGFELTAVAPGRVPLVCDAIHGDRNQRDREARFLHLNTIMQAVYPISSSNGFPAKEVWAISETPQAASATGGFGHEMSIQSHEDPLWVQPL